MPITCLLLTSHLKFYNLPTNPPTYLNVLPTYLLTYLPINPLVTYLNVLTTYPPTHIFRCITYLPIHPPITYLHINYLPSHTPTSIHVLCTYIPTYMHTTYPPTCLSTYSPAHPPTYLL